MRAEPQPTPEQQARGWVVRRAEPGSDAMLVRGARRADAPSDYRRGFVYVETAAEAEAYDVAWNYVP